MTDSTRAGLDNINPGAPQAAAPAFPSWLYRPAARAVRPPAGHAPAPVPTGALERPGRATMEQGFLLARLAHEPDIHAGLEGGGALLAGVGDDPRVAPGPPGSARRPGSRRRTAFEHPHKTRSYRKFDSMARASRPSATSSTTASTGLSFRRVVLRSAPSSSTTSSLRRTNTALALAMTASRYCSALARGDRRKGHGEPRVAGSRLAGDVPAERHHHPPAIGQAKDQRCGRTCWCETARTGDAQVRGDARTGVPHAHHSGLDHLHPGPGWPGGSTARS